ncbi:MAG: nodulation protein NfeD [Phycisphaerales bacterium JB060]
MTNSPSTIPTLPWRAARVVFLSMLLLCLAAVEVGMAQDAGSAEAQPAPAASVPASRQAQEVVVLPIRTAIDRFTMKSLEQRMQRAQDAGARAVVIELDTPGGEVGAVLEISDLLKKSQIPTIVAWVNTTAYSGGAIIAMACDEIVTNDPGTLGDALPINVSMIMGLQPLPPEERQKILAPLLVDLVDSARRNGQDEKLMQGFVSLGVELWLIERTQPGSEGQHVGERLFIDKAEYRMLFGEPPAMRSPEIPSAAGDEQPAEQPEDLTTPADPADPTAFRPAAPQLESLDDKDEVSRSLAVPTTRPTLSESDRGAWKVVAYVADGKAPVTMTSEQLVRYGVANRVVRNDEELKAFFGATSLVRYEESGWMAIARFLSNPIVRGLLLVGVIVGFFVEMASPGMGVFGAIGLLALIGLLAPAAMVGMAGWWEFAALGAGAVLVLLEIFVFPGLGLPGAIGAVLVFVGLLGTFTGGNGFQTQGELLTGLVVLLLSLATAGVIIFLIARNLGRIPVFSRLILQNSSADDEDENPTFFEAMLPSTPKAELAVGAVGHAVGTLRPSGRASFGEELVDVVSVGPIIEHGQRVRVVESTAFSVVVERADDTDTDIDTGTNTESQPRGDA